jgi:hypothetical protein
MSAPPSLRSGCFRARLSPSDLPASSTTVKSGDGTSDVGGFLADRSAHSALDSHSALDDRDAHRGGVGEKVEYGAVPVDDVAQLLVTPL